MPRPEVVVVGLGPADPGWLTQAARAALDRVPVRFVRTTRHPSAGAVGPSTSFDPVYEAAATLEEVYLLIVDALVEAAYEHGQVLYAVPGSPFVAERTVELLRADARVATEMVAGLSFLDLAWDRLGVDPLAGGVRLVDGHRFSVEAAGERGPLLVAQCDTLDVLSDVKLAVEGEPPATAIVLHHLGLDDERVETVAWADLDRGARPDHLTSLFVPELAAPVAGEVARFAELVRTLRQRCPWDREQTHATLTRHLLEETYEVLEAVAAMDEPGGDGGYGHLEDELGDLLFQVVFHATLASEAGQFTLADVARGVHDKLVGRHPHVFGDVQADTAADVMRNWERIKKAERAATSVMDGIPAELPSLLYAHKVQRKAASLGIDWPSLDEGWTVLGERMGEARADPGNPTVGELLLAAVGVARHLNVDPEAALRAAAGRLRDQVMAVEAQSASSSSSSSSPTPV